MGYQLNYYSQDAVKDYQAIGRNLGYYEDPLRPANGDFAAAHADLYNGNIGAMITGLYLPDGNGTLTHDLQAMAYRYDQLNRIREAQSFDNFTYSNATWASNAGGHDDYHALYTYDGNGNLQTLTRKGHRPSGSGSTLTMDQLSYHYTSGTNRLEYVSDAVSNPCDDYDDIEDQAAGKTPTTPSGSLPPTSRRTSTASSGMSITRSGALPLPPA